MATNTTTSGQEAIMSGWASQSKTRGTLDTIWTCVITVFIALWTVLCLNVPAKNNSKLQIISRKLRWMGFIIAGPEFVLGAAAGQRESAYRRARDLKSMGHPNWTIRHAFFADMSSIMLYPRNSAPFPVNNMHLLWLVQNGHIPVPMIDEREIWDRSKADLMIRLISAVQITWLLLSVAARRVRNLAITTMELGTVANATYSLLFSLS